MRFRTEGKLGSDYQWSALRQLLQLVSVFVQLYQPIRLTFHERSVSWTVSLGFRIHIGPPWWRHTPSLLASKHYTQVNDAFSHFR